MNGIYQSKALRLSELMQNDIRNGCFRKREYLPSEQELGKHYGVSRATVRRVISILITDGVLIKEPNKTARIRTNGMEKEPEKSQAEKTLSLAFFYAGVPDGFIVGVSEGAKDFCRETNCELLFFSRESGHT